VCAFYTNPYRRPSGPKRGGLFDETRRIRLLVEADVPEIEFFSLVIEHKQNLDAVWRALLPIVAESPATRITDRTRPRRRRTQRVPLTLPDHTVIEIGPTGRPPKPVQEWKKKGYKVDWNAREMVKMEEE